MKKPDSLKQGAWPTFERQRQEGGIAIDGVGLTSKNEVIQLRAKAKYPSKLHRYCGQYELITTAQRDAGLRYGELFERSGWMPIYPVPYARLAPGGGRMDWTAEKMAAQVKLKAAEVLLAQEERPVVRLVCGYDEFVSGRGWRERQQQAMYLVSGLQKLTGFFHTEGR